MTAPNKGDKPPKPSEKEIDTIIGYKQIYIVKRKTNEAPKYHEVFFQCGDFCYDGYIRGDFLGKHTGKMTVEDLSIIPRALQEHQHHLSFLCLADSLQSKSFVPALEVMEKANSFLGKELASPSVQDSIVKERLDQFDEGHFFELVADASSEMDGIECICCKTYTKELCFVTFYFEGIFYAVLQPAKCDVPLLDITFPDISKESKGYTLAIYDNEDREDIWSKLSFWHPIGGKACKPTVDPQPASLSLSSANYGQSYCILKPTRINQSIREVLFRFGNWVYSGEVELIPKLCIHDIQYVIPTLRLQQQKLAFLCPASEMSTDNLFTDPLAYMSEISALMEREVLQSEGAVHLLQKQSRLDETEDTKNLFFQFDTVVSEEQTILEKCHIDCIATKTYNPNGLVIMNIYFRGSFYVCLGVGKENQPLLDSEFPCLVQGKGYQIKRYPSGLPRWPGLRKLSLWRNAESLTSMKVEDEESLKINDEHGVDTGMINDNGIRRDEKVDAMKECARLGYSIEPKHRKSTFDTPAKDIAESKEYLISSPSKSVGSSKKASLGKFHHLAPLKKTSKLEKVKQKNIHDSAGLQVQWDEKGKPHSSQKSS